MEAGKQHKAKVQTKTSILHGSAVSGLVFKDEGGGKARGREGREVGEREGRESGRKGGEGGWERERRGRVSWPFSGCLN